MLLDKTIVGGSGPIYDVFQSEDFLYTAGSDKFVIRWDKISGEQTKWAVRCSAATYSLCILENHLWIGLSNGDLHIIDLVQNKEIKFFKQHTQGVFSIESLANQKQILTTDATGLVCVWNNETLELELSLPLECGKIRRIAKNADESLIALPALNGEIRIMETKSFNEIVRLPGHGMGTNVCVFRNDEPTLISGGKDGYLKVWDWQKEILIKAIPAHYSAIYDCVFDGNNFYTASRDKFIKIWDSSLNFISKIGKPGPGHTHSVNGLLNMGDSLVSFSDDHQVKIWKKSI